MPIQDIFKEDAHINDLDDADLIHLVEVCEAELLRRGVDLERVRMSLSIPSESGVNEELMVRIRQARKASGWEG